MKSAKTKERFIELRAQGWSFDRIATELDVSKNTLIGWSRDLEVEILNAGQIQLDRLREMHLLTKAAKIESFGKQLKRISEELEKRDLTEMPTEKLFTAFLRMHEAIGNEITGIEFAEKVNFIRRADDMTTVEKWTA